MLDCRQVAAAVASGELEGAGARRRLAVWFHLLMCRYCRAYARQMRLLGEVARRLLGREPANLERLARLEAELVERCYAGPGEDDGS